MAIRYKALTELYQETQRKVTAPAEWRQFLTSACRNYRLSFDEQLLVYAQRPDATAVLEIERWNKRFGRWVNRGANGIAVFDGEHSGKQRLKYYFDVSDTHEGRFSRPVPLWTVRPEYAPDIIEAMENSFGELEQKDDLGAGTSLCGEKCGRGQYPRLSFRAAPSDRRQFSGGIGRVQCGSDVPAGVAGQYRIYAGGALRPRPV